MPDPAMVAVYIRAAGPFRVGDPWVVGTPVARRIHENDQVCLDRCDLGSVCTTGVLMNFRHFRHFIRGDGNVWLYTEIAAEHAVTLEMMGYDVESCQPRGPQSEKILWTGDKY